MSFRFQHHTLFFHKPAKTSRDVLTQRDVYYVQCTSDDGAVAGLGECAPIWGLSPESKAEVERTLSGWNNILQQPEQVADVFNRISSLRFAVETTLRDMASGGAMQPFDADLKRSIPINGLIWMSDAASMLLECREKVEAGFTTIKFKVGALDFEEELRLLQKVRSEFAERNLEIRLDANGAFTPENAVEKLDALSTFRIHSIEQPIKAGQREAMAHLIEKSPMAIALDEELIGVHALGEKQKLIGEIRPHYLVLKPTLHGGFSGCDEWVTLAEEMGIGWWATSALESNVGLNAIAQWVLTKHVTMPQGLGTGSLFSNNIQSPWVVENGFLRYDDKLRWNLKSIFP
ncbi:MAG: o-succinylbenzoate synthase [Flavobacteriales bacterium]